MRHRSPPNTNTLERVYRIIDSIIPDEYGCKNWPNRNPGYPALVSIQNKRMKVARIVLERKLGRPIKLGYCVLHTCDWASCINEDHLYEGTKKNNSQDRIKRNPESYNHLRNPNRKWHDSPEGKAHLKRIQLMGTKARWNQGTDTKK